MCKCVVNVQMCECANVRMVALIYCALLLANAQLYKGDNLHICTFSHLHINQAFAHSHIYTLMLVHNHLKATIQVARDAVGTDGAHFRYVEALTTT